MASSRRKGIDESTGRSRPSGSVEAANVRVSVCSLVDPKREIPLQSGQTDALGGATLLLDTITNPVPLSVFLEYRKGGYSDTLAMLNTPPISLDLDDPVGMLYAGGAWRPTGPRLRQVAPISGKHPRLREIVAYGGGTTLESPSIILVAHLSPSFERRDSVAQLPGPEVHVAVRDGDRLVPGEVLDRLRNSPTHREMRAGCC